MNEILKWLSASLPILMQESFWWWQCRVVLLLLKCCFMSTKTVGLLGTGAQDGHLDFHTAPEL